MKTIEILEKREEFLTVKELAKVLGCSSTHLYRRIHNGEIEGVFRDGWNIKICPSTVADSLKKKMVKGSCPRKRNLSRLGQAVAG